MADAKVSSNAELERMELQCRRLEAQGDGFLCQSRRLCFVCVETVSLKYIRFVRNELCQLESDKLLVQSARRGQVPASPEMLVTWAVRAVTCFGPP